MRKVALLASILLLAPSAALAQTPATDPITIDITFSSDYLFERFGAEIKGPVANVAVNAELGGCFSANVWGQVGEEDLANEIDVTATCTATVGSMDVYGTVGVYLAKSAQPIYVTIVGANVPLTDTVSLELQADHLEGGYETNILSAALAGNAGPVSLAVGKTYNEADDVSPWFVRANIPIADSDWSIGARGYFGDGHGWVLDLRNSF